MKDMCRGTFVEIQKKKRPIKYSQNVSHAMSLDEGTFLHKFVV